MGDRYESFAALAAGETLGLHYRICLVDRGTPVVVLAPHGGKIEPGSSRIAAAIAREDYSLYCFEGLCSGRLHGDLHITSDRFDEPRSLRLVAAATTAIAIHGRQDRSDPKTVWMGGRDMALRDAVASSLISSGFPAITSGHPLSGQHPTNICNRGAAGAGVQVEVPATLRDHLVRDQTALQRFSEAVRAPLANR
jgi:phage replication-related protein YjqB (UPF0714/DUF867 family)